MYSAQYQPLPQTAAEAQQIHHLRSVTPVHSPHPSLSSTRSRTPGQTLSLHEYRRQQATPSPPITAADRSLKRRKGASGLNGIERAPRPASHGRRTPASSKRLQSLLPREQTAGPASFFSLSRIPPPPSTLSSSPASIGHSARSRTLPLLTSTPSTVGPEKNTLRNFKSIKHLPRREAQRTEPVFATVSFAPSPSSSPAPAARPSTTSPTVSLSRFPQPPRRAESHPAALATDFSGQPQPVPATAPAPGQPTTPHSAPPTVLHYRGASFDLVNPHRSLQLGDIQTPGAGERDSDSSDYFKSDPTAGALTALTADMSPRARHDTVLSDDHNTPSRALYDDFASAHESITARSNKSSSSPHLKRHVNSDAAAGPDVFAPTVGYHPGVSEENAANSKQPRRTPSVKQRLSKAWRGAIDSFRVMDQAVADQGGELATLPEQRVIAGQGITNQMQSAPRLRPMQEEAFEAERPNRVSMSMGDLRSPNPVREDDEYSTYPSSLFLGLESQPSYPASVMDPRQSVTTCRHVGERDLSSEADDESVTFEYSPSPHPRGNSLSRSFSESHRQSRYKDSTLQAIFAQYQSMGGDVSEGSLNGIHDDDENAIPIEFAVSGPGTAQESTSSLNETIATNTSSQGSSNVPSPKTPDSNVFHTPHGHVIYSSAGVPPNVPLPLLNPMAALGPRMSYGPSGLSDVTSGADSYGDTRHLLLLSQQFAEDNTSNLNVRQQENASLSSQALPNVDETGRMSPETVFRASPPPMSPPSMSPPLSPTVHRGSPIGVGSGRASPTSDSRPETAVSSNREYMTPAEYPEGEYFDEEGGQELTPRPFRQLARSRNASPDVEFARGARVPTPIVTSSPMSVKSSGVPIMWGNKSPRPMSGVSKQKHESSGGDSWAGVSDYHEDEGDWETVADPSRPTLTGVETMSSMADYSDTWMLESRGLLPDFGYSDDRSSSYYSDDLNRRLLSPSLTPMPLFQRQGNQAPSLSRDHAHTLRPPPPEKLRASPPRQQQTTFEFVTTPRGKEVAKEEPVECPHAHECVREATQPRVLFRSWTIEDFFDSGSARPSGSRGPTLSELLTAGPNDEILYDDDFHQATHEATTSPGFGSSPLSASDREDSFSKFTILGPKMNLTGTPEGTGMKQVGSSLVGTSSPNNVPGSTPLQSSAFASSPPTQEFGSTPITDEEYGQEIQHEQHDEQSPSVGRKRSATPISPTPVVHDYSDAPLPMPTTSPREYRFETGNLTELREQKRREREERRLAALRSQEQQRRSSKRASVLGQTQLREMRLVKDHQDAISPTSPTGPVEPHSKPASGSRKWSKGSKKVSISTVSTRFSNFNHSGSVSAPPTIMGARRQDSADSGWPIFPGGPRRSLSIDERPNAELLRKQAEKNPPELFSTPSASVHAAVRREQNFWSWTLFTCALCFPPVLIIFRHKGDRAVAILSSGRVLQASDASKTAAMWTGISLCTTVPIVITVVIVLVHFDVLG